MLYYALMFLVVGVIAGALNMAGVAAVAVQISWILFLIGIVLLAIHLFSSRSTRESWPADSPKPEPITINCSGVFKEISMKLADKKCSDGGSVPPLKALRARELLKELGQGWKLNGRGHLERGYTFKDFAQSLAFANKVGAVAEAEGHHPDLYVAWGKCKIEIWSHKIKGLTESDFILAAKAERKFKPFRTPA
jgi:4a-hydroxytetrahydrobiopterin dehydratase